MSGREKGEVGGKGSKWEGRGEWKGRGVSGREVGGGGGGVNGREGKWTRGRGSLLFNGCFGRVC